MSKVAAFCIIVAVVKLVDGYAQLGETMNCADGDCSETVSEGKTKLTYQPSDRKFLNFKKGDVVLVKGKKAGLKTDLWGGQEFVGQADGEEELSTLSTRDQKIMIQRKKLEKNKKAAEMENNDEQEKPETFSDTETQTDKEESLDNQDHPQEEDGSDRNVADKATAGSSQDSNSESNEKNSDQAAVVSDDSLEDKNQQPELEPSRDVNQPDNTDSNTTDDSKKNEIVKLETTEKDRTPSKNPSDQNEETGIDSKISSSQENDIDKTKPNHGERSNMEAQPVEDLKFSSETDTTLVSILEAISDAQVVPDSKDHLNNIEASETQMVSADHPHPYIQSRSTAHSKPETLVTQDDQSENPATETVSNIQSQEDLTSNSDLSSQRVLSDTQSQSEPQSSSSSNMHLDADSLSNSDLPLNPNAPIDVDIELKTQPDANTELETATLSKPEVQFKSDTRIESTDVSNPDSSSETNGNPISTSESDLPQQDTSVHENQRESDSHQIKNASADPDAYLPPENLTLQQPETLTTSDSVPGQESQSKSDNQKKPNLEPHSEQGTSAESSSSPELETHIEIQTSSDADIPLGAVGSSEPETLPVKDSSSMSDTKPDSKTSTDHVAQSDAESADETTMTAASKVSSPSSSSEEVDDRASAVLTNNTGSPVVNESGKPVENADPNDEASDNKGDFVGRESSFSSEEKKHSDSDKELDTPDENVTAVSTVTEESKKISDSSEYAVKKNHGDLIVEDQDALDEDKTTIGNVEPKGDKVKSESEVKVSDGGNENIDLSENADTDAHGGIQESNTDSQKIMSVEENSNTKEAELHNNADLKPVAEEKEESDSTQEEQAVKLIEKEEIDVSAQKQDQKQEEEEEIKLIEDEEIDGFIPEKKQEVELKEEEIDVFIQKQEVEQEEGEINGSIQEKKQESELEDENFDGSIQDKKQDVKLKEEGNDVSIQKQEVEQEKGEVDDSIPEKKQEFELTEEENLDGSIQQQNQEVVHDGDEDESSWIPRNKTELLSDVQPLPLTDEEMESLKFQEAESSKNDQFSNKPPDPSHSKTEDNRNVEPSEKIVEPESKQVSDSDDISLQSLENNSEAQFSNETRTSDYTTATGDDEAKTSDNEQTLSNDAPTNKDAQFNDEATSASDVEDTSNDNRIFTDVDDETQSSNNVTNDSEAQSTDTESRTNDDEAQYNEDAQPKDIITSDNEALTSIDETHSRDDEAQPDSKDTQTNDEEIQTSDDEAQPDSKDTQTNDEEIQTSDDESQLDGKDTHTNDEEVQTSDDEALTSIDEIHSRDDEARSTKEQTQTDDEEVQTSDDEAQNDGKDTQTNDEEIHASDDEAQNNGKDAQTDNEEIQTSEYEAQSTEEEIQTSDDEAQNDGKDTQTDDEEVQTSEYEAQSTEEEIQINDAEIQTRDDEAQNDGKDTQTNDEEVQTSDDEPQNNGKDTQTDDEEVQTRDDEAQLTEEEIQINDEKVQTTDDEAQTEGEETQGSDHKTQLNSDETRTNEDTTVDETETNNDETKTNEDETGTNDDETRTNENETGTTVDETRTTMDETRTNEYETRTGDDESSYSDGENRTNDAKAQSRDNRTSTSDNEVQTGDHNDSFTDESQFSDESQSTLEIQSSEFNESRSINDKDDLTISGKDSEMLQSNPNRLNVIPEESTHNQKHEQRKDEELKEAEFKEIESDPVLVEESNGASADSFLTPNVQLIVGDIENDGDDEGNDDTSFSKDAENEIIDQENVTENSEENSQSLTAKTEKVVEEANGSQGEARLPKIDNTEHDGRDTGSPRNQMKNDDGRVVESNDEASPAKPGRYNDAPEDDEDFDAEEDEEDSKEREKARQRVEELEAEILETIEDDAATAGKLHGNILDLKDKLTSIVNEMKLLKLQIDKPSSKEMHHEAKELKQQLLTVEEFLNALNLKKTGAAVQREKEDDFYSYIEKLESKFEDVEGNAFQLRKARGEIMSLSLRIEKLGRTLQSEKSQAENLIETLLAEVEERKRKDDVILLATEREAGIMQTKLKDLEDVVQKRKNIILEELKIEALNIKVRLNDLEKEVTEKKQTEASINILPVQEDLKLQERILSLESEVQRRKNHEKAMYSFQYEAATLKEKVLALDNEIKNIVDKQDAAMHDRFSTLESELKERKTNESDALYKTQTETGKVLQRLSALEERLKDSEDSSKDIAELRQLKTEIQYFEAELANRFSSSRASINKEEELQQRIILLEEELQKITSREEESVTDAQRTQAVIDRVKALEARLNAGEQAKTTKLNKDDILLAFKEATLEEVENGDDTLKELWNIMLSKQKCNLNEDLKSEKGSQDSISTERIPDAPDSECAIPSERRIQCGMSHAPEALCLAHQCCWSFDSNPIIPNCYYSATQLHTSRETMMENLSSGNKNADADDAKPSTVLPNKDAYEELHEGKIVNWDESFEKKEKKSSWDEELGDKLAVEDSEANETLMRREEEQVENEMETLSTEPIPVVETTEVPSMVEPIPLTEASHDEMPEPTIESLVASKEGQPILPDTSHEEPLHEDVNRATAIDDATKKPSYADDSPWMDDDATNSSLLSFAVLVCQLPNDIKHVLVPLGRWWISLLPEEYHEDVYGVSWSIILLTSVLGIFLIWIIIWWSNVTKRIQKERGLAMHAEELHAQLEVLLAEKLETENLLTASKNKVSNMHSRYDEMQALQANAQEEINQLKIELEILLCGNNEKTELYNQLSVKMNDLEKDRADIIKASKKKENCLEEEKRTFLECERSLAQVKMELTESSEQQQSLEESVKQLQKFLNEKEQTVEEHNETLRGWEKQGEAMKAQINTLEEKLSNITEEKSATMQEADVLKDCLLQFRGVQEALTEDGDEELDTDELVDKQKEKLKSLIDVARIQTKVKQVETEKSRVVFQLETEKKSRERTEAQVGELEAECENIRAMQQKTTRELQVQQAKLNVMQEFYAKREVEMQGKLGKEQTVREINESKLAQEGDRTSQLLDQLEMYKKMNEDAKREFDQSEKQRKNEINRYEKKAHDSWLASREAERKLEEADREMHQLKMELSALEQRLRDAETREPFLFRPRPLPPGGMFPGPNTESPIPMRNGPPFRDMSPPPGRHSGRRSPSGSMDDHVRPPSRSLSDRRPPSQGPPIESLEFGDGPPRDLGIRRGTPRRGPPSMHEEPVRGGLVPRSGVSPSERDAPFSPRRDEPPLFMRGGPPPSIRDRPPLPMTGGPPIRDMPPFPLRDWPHAMREGPPVRDGPPMRDGPPRDGFPPIRGRPPFIHNGSPMPLRDDLPVMPGPPLRRSGPSPMMHDLPPHRDGIPPHMQAPDQGPLTSSPYMEHPVQSHPIRPPPMSLHGNLPNQAVKEYDLHPVRGGGLP